MIKCLQCPPPNKIEVIFEHALVTDIFKTHSNETDLGNIIGIL